MGKERSEFVGLEPLGNCGFLAVILYFPQREKYIENLSLPNMVNNKAAAFVDWIGILKAEINVAYWRELRNTPMNMFE